jgi:membrane-associated phospholipid phosphatase
VTEFRPATPGSATARQAADRRYGVRLVVAAVSVAVLAVPFTLLLLLVRVGWGPLRRLDQGVAERFNEVAADDGRFVGVLEAASDVFDPMVFRALALGLVIALIVGRRPRLAAWVGVTMAGASLLGFALKELVGRSRPVLPEPVSSAPGLSFPSGHALNSFVGVAILLLVFSPWLPRGGRALVWLLGAGIVALTGFARIGLGVHFLSDVAGAWILGFGWVAAMVAVFETWRHDVGLRRTAPQEGLEPEAAEPG